MAEHAVSLLRRNSATHKRAARIVRDARRADDKGWPRGEALRHQRIASHAARLAQLDAVYRAAYPPTFGEEDGVAEAAIANEVVQLLGVARPLWELASSKPLLLNPTFGAMSHAVGGADADLIAGDTLVEIKTTRHARIERDHMRQLVGYAALARACKRRARMRAVRAVAVYFSRFGVLQRVSLPAGIAAETYARVASSLGEIWRSRRAA